MAIYEDLEVEQGAYFRYSIDITTTTGSAYDLTDHTFSAVMKKNYSSTAIAATFAVETTAKAGEIQLILTSANSVNVKAGRYVFDVLMTAPDTQKHRVIEGIITLSPSVTS